MPYTTGAQGAQTNVASVFMTTLDPLLVAAGFTFVEQYTASTNTCRIYKSPAASNYFGQDWYLDVWRTADTTASVNFSVAELYEVGTHVMKNYAPSASSGLTPTSVFAVNDATGKTPENAALGVRALQTQAAGFNYFLSLTPDRVIIATRGGTTDSCVYVGLYDDLQTTAISPFPLGMIHMQAANGYATREPNTLAANTNNFRMTLTAASIPWTQPIITAELYSGRIWLSRVMATGRTTAAVRGLLRDIWTTGPSGVMGVNGDTLTTYIGGTSKTLVQMREGTLQGMFVDTVI